MPKIGTRRGTHSKKASTLVCIPKRSSNNQFCGVTGNERKEDLIAEIEVRLHRRIGARKSGEATAGASTELECLPPTVGQASYADEHQGVRK